MGRPRPISRPWSRTGENPPYGILGGTMETSASFEARSAPSSYPTSRQSGFCASLHKAGQNRRIRAGLCQRKGPGEAANSDSRAMVRNFSPLTGEPGPFTRFSGKSRASRINAETRDNFRLYLSGGDVRSPP